MKNIVMLLFLALLAQGEDLHLELLKLPSAPEVKWLETNEVAVQMVTSGRQVTLASEDQSMYSFPPVTSTEWTTEEEILRMVNRRQVSLAYNGEPQPGFPNFLGFGTREELRNFIVAVRGMGMNVWLTIQYEKSTGGYFQIKVGKFSDGYPSFNVMLEDTVAGWKALIEKVKQKTDYKAGSEILVQMTVTYFNGNSNIIPKPFGLGLVRGDKWTRETVNAEEVASSFTSLGKDDAEIMVAPFPEIKRFELQLSLTNNVIATMTWTKEAGAQLASWPKDFPEEVEDSYIAVSGWLCDGSHRMRMKVSTVNGVETYTEFGRRLTEPTVLRMYGKVLNVKAPKGAIVTIQSSPPVVNFPTWINRGSVRVTGDLSLDVPDSGQEIFRARID